jgi:formate dehydrogenase alpha subunit
MKVRSDTEKALAAQTMVIDLQLSAGDHDCLSCQKNGNCELQSAAHYLGLKKPSYALDPVRYERSYDASSESIILDASKCVKCGRCVDACNKVVMHEVLNFGKRGHDMQVICDDDLPMGESSCVRCGECVQVCPTGALVAQAAEGIARTWELKKTRTICVYCGVGCNIDVVTKGNKILYGLGTQENWQDLPNQGSLCVKGRFGLDFVNSPERLTTPLIRKGGKLVEASWDEAMTAAAAGLQKVMDKDGARAIGCLSSAKVSNEENYAMMRFARGVLKTNNIDHCARLCHASTVAGLAATLGSGAMTNSMQEVMKSDVILVTGSNTTWCHPVFGGMIKRAVKEKGVKLIVIDPREIDLAKVANIHVRQKGGSDVAWLMAVQKIIIDNGWHNQAFIDTRCEGWDAYHQSLQAYTPEVVSAISGISEEDLYAIAKLYATGGRAAIYFSMGITQHSHGVDNVKAISNLALITGNLGVEGGGINPLRGQSNVQGACDMGALPNVFSGYQPVGDAGVREKYAKAWGIDRSTMDTENGLPVTVMIEEAGEQIKALYIMGENPMMADPNLRHAEAQLKKLDFIVVQDIFLTETALLADVVLPAASFAEKLGTFVNTERRVQIGRPVIDPLPGVRQDYEIIADMATRFGATGFPTTPIALFDEMRMVTPSYRGMTYARLDKVGLRWPCPTEDHPGTPILHKERFTRGLALLAPLEYRPSMELPCGEYPLLLSTGRLLEHYHTGSMSRRSYTLNTLVPDGEVEIHPHDAAGLGVSHGDMVQVQTRRGTVKTRANVTTRIDKGALFMAFHFAEAPANLLTNDALDPIAKIPEFKVCAARLERAQ